MAGIKKGAELRQKIIDTAWELFYENGYENTTVNDIIRKVGTSKGGFYYYFKAKEDLLNSLYSVFDREYEKFYENMDQNQDSLMKLKQLSQYVSYFIEGNVSAELLAALYQSQLAKKSQDNFLNPDMPCSSFSPARRSSTSKLRAFRFSAPKTVIADGISRPSPASETMYCASLRELN